jgi:hypothetical protein
MTSWPNWQMRLLVGFFVGAAIVFIDNFAFQGEVSPIVIVLLLLGSTIAFGAIWKWQAWMAAVIVWISVPIAHVGKHLLGIPDTLQPNTYTSILLLAVFTLVISAIGLLFGILINQILKDVQKI